MRKTNSLLVVSVLSMLAFALTPPVWGDIVQLMLRVEGATTSTVSLAWSVFPSAFVTGFELYRSADGRNFDLLTKTPNSEPRFVDETVEPGVVYTYKVRAEQSTPDGKKYSDFSRPVQAAAVPGEPVLSVDERTNGGKDIQLTWTSVSGAHGYEVYQSKMIGGQYDTAELVATVREPSYLRSGMVPQLSYRFKVRAFIVLAGHKVFGEFSNAVESEGKAPTNGDGGGPAKT